MTEEELNLRRIQRSVSLGNIEFWSPEEKEKFIEDIDKQIKEINNAGLQRKT